MNIDKLLAPIPPAQFFGASWEQHALHVRRGVAGYYDDLLATADIENQLFGNRNLTPSWLKVCRGKEELGALHWSDTLASGDWASNVVSPQKLLAALRQGYSVYMNFPERIFPRLRASLSEMERDLKLKALSHLIISPPRSQGFLPHTDPYGVLVLQLSGAKRWLSHGIRDRRPSSQGVDHHHLAQEPPLETFEVCAGDLLYLPRGTVHSAATARAHSIHLSLALVPARGVDLMRLIEGVAEHRAFFQEYIPYGLGAGGEAREAYARRFKEQLIDLIEGADLFELLDRHHHARRGGASSAHPLTELFDVEEVNLATKVQVRAGLRYDLSFDREADKCRLAFEGVTLEFPGQWHQGLDDLLAIREFHVRAIGETLPIADLDRVQVARNLLHAGFLELTSYYRLPGA
ncbi:cupin domain-containing protein [Sorangium sp. So ce134]